MGISHALLLVKMSPNSTRWAERCQERSSALWLGLLSLLSLLGVAAGPPVLQGSRPGALPLHTEQIAAYQAAQSPPAMSAAAALLADSDSGEILWSQQPDQSRPMASITKIMTALLVLEHSDLDELVVVSPSALVGEATMGLVAGEQISVEDLLWGLLLNSANDAAVALAEHVAGSEAAFVELMNQRAADLGLTGTQFANAHGLDAPNHASTARDLWRLTEVAMQSPVFRDMVATQAYTAAGHPLWNQNELLATYPGADGIKTGTTDLAGQCLVASVTRNGHRVLAVILGSQDRYGDAQVLLDHDAAIYRWMPAPQPQGPVAWIRSSDGTPWRVTAPDAPELFLPRWQWPLVRTHATLGQISGDPTQAAGTVRWELGDTLLAEAPAFLSRF